MNKLFFVFDVESIGLHGEGFAVGGGLYQSNSAALWEFRFACDPNECIGNEFDRDWVRRNVPILEVTHRGPIALRTAFWAEWMKARRDLAVMVADCGWPVESRFLEWCISDNVEKRKGNGPYPFHELASYLSAAGFDPLAKYDRHPSELPVHDPLADARQSARLLSMAIFKLTERKANP